jgi:hypothetical protein
MMPLPIAPMITLPRMDERLCDLSLEILRERRTVLTGDDAPDAWQDAGTERICDAERGIAHTCQARCRGNLCPDCGNNLPNELVQAAATVKGLPSPLAVTAAFELRQFQKPNDAGFREARITLL